MFWLTRSRYVVSRIGIRFGIYDWALMVFWLLNRGLDYFFKIIVNCLEILLLINKKSGVMEASNQANPRPTLV